jgi:hypothetical protein
MPTRYGPDYDERRYRQQPPVARRYSVNYQGSPTAKYVSGSEPQGRSSPIANTRGTNRTDFNTPMGSEIDWYNWGRAEGQINPPTGTVPSITTPYSPGGGGRGGGGGGGGGAAAPTLDQGTLNAMLAALSRRPQQFDAPDYQGMPAAPFSTAPWDTMRSSVDTAAAADRAAAQQGYGQLAQTLGSTFTNAYNNAPTQATPQVQNAMTGLLQRGGVAPGAGDEAINAENAYSRNSDQAFANLLGVLGAGAQQSQASRLAQVGMDANTAQQGINANAFGMRSAADVQQANALQAYQQQQAQQAQQDNLLRQQWNREEGQTNAATNNQFMQSQLGPLLELINAGGTAGLDLSGLLAMLQGGQ